MTGMAVHDPNEAVLEVEGLCVSWDGEPVCRDISLSLRSGEIACMVGRSGVGKTTIFHAIAGLTKPDSGHVLLHGEDVTGTPGKISYMLQKDLLLEEHRVIDNIAMPLIVKGMRKRDARAVVESKLADFGLEGTGQLYPSQLSGGMRQRAALLRTYLMDNDVVLMDEPFSALDAFTRNEMRIWLQRMLGQLGLSCLLVTHDVDEAISMGDRIYVLRGKPMEGIPSTIVKMIDAHPSSDAAYIDDVRQCIFASIE